MSWTHNSDTAKQSGTNSVAVNLPAAPAGDAVFIFCARAFSTGISYSATGWTTLKSRTINNSTAILYRVFDGTEGSTISVAGTGSSSTYFTSWFSGGPTAANFASSIVVTNEIGSSGSAGLNWPALVIGANPGCLVLVLAAKQSTLTSYNVPAQWDAEIQHSVSGDGGQSFVADYQIQVAAADVSTGTWTVGGDGSTAHQGIMAAILPAAVVLAPPSSGGIFVCP